MRPWACATEIRARERRCGYVSVSGRSGFSVLTGSATYDTAVIIKECLINPRRACAARVTVLGLSVSQCVCPRLFSHCRQRSGSERHQQLQRNKRSKIKMAILLKRRRSRSRNWHYRGSPGPCLQPLDLSDAYNVEEDGRLSVCSALLIATSVRVTSK